MSDDAMIRPRSGPTLTRRVAIAAGGAGALLAATAPAATAHAAGMRSVSQVVGEARNHLGWKLAGSPWQSYFSGLSTDWCAMFVSWLIRDQIGPKSASSTAVYDFYSARGRTGTTPKPGALILYTENGARSGIFHIGIVESVINGVAQTIEGNTPGSLPYTQTYVKAYPSPWGPPNLYAYPEYADSPAGDDDLTPEQDSMLTNLYNAMFFGGPSMPSGLSISAILQPGKVSRGTGELPATVGTIGEYSMFQEVADAKTLLLKQQIAVAQLGAKIDDISARLG